ncbi:MAG: DEAD/DEAH box helicase [Chloroflexi bacterium]|nr:DEAD/DEAH box helicase [Chloroflexota bacterium]
MRGELVALDLETTGLDPAADTIIEIGIVRMNAGVITAEYSTLVNPGRPIPVNITTLTGIQPEEVIGAPAIAQVLPAISTFVGNAPVIAHNAAFDLGFLCPHGILQTNLRLDTYELASVLLPRAAGYGLASLSVQYGITHERKHRALDDARAAALLYWALWEKALQLPYAALYEICMAAQGIEWDARPVFEAALEERRAERSTPPTGDDPYRINSLAAPDEVYETLHPNPAAAEVPLENITAILDETSILAQQIPGYEKRPPQIQMALAIADTLNQSGHILIEADTGTGKSLAYLLPTMLWAARNNDRVVISTNTINLQEQLINREIPALKAALNLPIKTAVLKGRSNYLCPRRLAALRRRRPTHVDELRTLAKILVWLLENGSGDRGEISLRGPVENSIWQRLSAEDESCSLERCRATMEGACPFYKARKAAESAHLLVINHALLLSDALSGQAVMPDYRHLILDEAHNLEDAATNSLLFRLDEAVLRRRLADLGSANQGLLGDLLRSVRSSVPDKQAARLEAFVHNIGAAVAAMEVHIAGLFGAFRKVLYPNNSSRAGDYHVQLRITPQLRATASFEACRAAWLPLREFFDVIGEAMQRLADGLHRLQNQNIANYHDLVSGTSAVARHLAEIQSQLHAFTVEPADNMIYWLHGGQNGYAAVNCAPLNVGALLKEQIWSRKNTVILTSATLRVANSFDYLRQRLGAEDANTLELGATFDYRASTLVFLPSDVPEPNDAGYQPAFERALVELATAIGGRTMVLFTSYTHLQQTKQAISARLELLGGITIYDQTEGGNRQALLEGFRTTERAVLMGTKSFWEGVDVPGEALSALVIARLPFAVPTDPIFAARSETYADGFKSYAVPDAVLRFRQGFGRLIRTASDRGIVAILDRRIISKSYGTSFLESLPDCTVQYGELRTLAETAKTWLNESSQTA